MTLIVVSSKANLFKYSPCCVDKLLVVLTVIDGVFVSFAWFPSAAFVSFESCRERENRRELSPKFATPLVTFATSELKKLIFYAHNSLLCYTIIFHRNINHNRKLILHHSHTFPLITICDNCHNFLVLLCLSCER